MASVFEQATKNMVQELSRDGELIPVDSLKNSTCFSPYNLVRKKTKSAFFWRSQYVWLNLTLKDILDPSSPEPEVTQHGPFHITNEIDGQVSGSMELTTSVQGKISGQTSVTNRTDLEIKILTVSPNTWDCLQKERKLKTPEPSIIQQLRDRGDNLYVVTEAVKTQKEAILKRSHKREGLGKIAIPGVSYFQGEGEGRLNTVKTVTVPEGSILAFQVAKLIMWDHWTVLLLSNKNQKTFPPKLTESMRIFQSDVCQITTVTDFEQLQDKVKSEKTVLLTMLDRKLKQLLLQALLRLLQNEQDLLDLEDMLEQSLYTGVPPQNVEGMKGNILSNLQDENGKLVTRPAEAFLSLLGSLNALSDIQHQLLIQLLEEKDKILLIQEAKLVKEILEKNFNQKEKTYSLPSELLSFVQGQDKKSNLAHALLEECGLGLPEDKSQFIWNPSALNSLCALYGSLVMLQALTEVW
ncbi:gasdermin-D-like [Macrotis lagotis]|uniref:gasdermin-D-like n=1 Tax=Macrotis lagotis TaxID=92651 RepID=UPI003D69E754